MKDTEEGKRVKEDPLSVLDMRGHKDYEKLLAVAMNNVEQVDSPEDVERLSDLGREFFRHYPDSKYTTKELSTVSSRWVTALMDSLSSLPVQLTSQAYVMADALILKHMDRNPRGYPNLEGNLYMFFDLLDDETIPYHVRKKLALEFVQRFREGYSFGMRGYRAFYEAMRCLESFSHGQKFRETFANRLIDLYLQGERFNATGRAAAEKAIMLAEKYVPERLGEVVDYIIDLYMRGDRFDLTDYAAAEMVYNLAKRYAPERIGEVAEYIRKTYKTEKNFGIHKRVVDEVVEKLLSS